MTPRQRFITAMKNRVPDRVPVTPDISNYIPCKRTKLPFWDIYFEKKIPLWKAYLDAADYFGIDPWIAASLDAPVLEYANSNIETIAECHLEKDRDAMIRRTIIKTPAGKLNTEETCFRKEPPSTTQKLIKNLEKDFDAFEYTQQIPTGLNRPVIEQVTEQCRKRNCTFGLTWSYPGLHMWNIFIQNGIQALAFAQIDTPRLLDRWFELDLEVGTKAIELFIQAKPDYILFGGSGTLTLSSPQLVMKYAIPALKKWTKMAKLANIPTILHSCGKSRILIDMLVEHTDLDCINPLEIPPMGDIDLAEVKKAHGKNIALMGNLHTTNVMLHGTPQQVKQASIQAIQNAAANGGFILSTGDQCGPQTPDENIFEMVKTAKKYGKY